MATLTVFLGGCGGGPGEPPSSASQGPDAKANAGGARASDCDEGTKPDYFVPGYEEGLVIGCARLGVSGKPVEFSVSGERFLSAGKERFIGDRDLCVNPAFRGPGGLGDYIPGVCLEGELDRLEIYEAGVRGAAGYRSVIWGTTPPGTREVVARWSGHEASTAIFKADRAFASRIRLETPFALFVTELPAVSACTSLSLVTADGRRTTRGPRPKHCPDD